MTSHSLRRLTAMEEVTLLDGERLAELLLAGAAPSGRETQLLRLARDLYRTQSGGMAEAAEGFRRCQWIAGEPSWSDDCKCEEPALEGESWCSHHRLRAYGLPEPLRESYIPAEEADWALVLQEDLA